MRKDLLTSISFFKEEIQLLYEVFDKAKYRSELGPETAGGTASPDVFSLSKRLRKLELTKLGESAERQLDYANDRFKDARRKATEAYDNEALGLSHRVMAMQYRVMATILETADNPENALAASGVCIEELHNLSAVRNALLSSLKEAFGIGLVRMNAWQSFAPLVM